MAILPSITHLSNSLLFAFSRFATKIDSTVPQQKKGSYSETVYTIVARSKQEARMIFTIAGHRLLNINQWHKLCGTLSALFTLTDRQGVEVDRLARAEDYFKINILGTETATGDTDDWVAIETLEDHTNPNSEREAITIKIGRALNPLQPNSRAAPFFKNTASSTFMVERNHNVIAATVNGGNEIPDNTAEDKMGNIRRVVATGALSGLSKLQLKYLVKGILNDI